MRAIRRSSHPRHCLCWLLTLLLSVLLAGEALASTPHVTGGHAHSLALKEDGTVWTWGANVYGQLGIGGAGEDQFSTRPVQVSGLTSIAAIAAGSVHNLALKSDGTVWAWGDNSEGQLGDGTQTQRSSPVQVAELQGIAAIAADMHSLALRSDGTVWSWGTSRSTPAPIRGLTGVVAIAAGGYFSLALKNDGTLWAWGNNEFGQLGIGSATEAQTRPVQVGGAPAELVAIAAGGFHTLAVTRAGGLWAWGSNQEFGQLGDGTLIASASPVPVSDLEQTGIAAIAAGYRHSLALDASNRLWAWGENWYGQLGIGHGAGHQSRPALVDETDILGIGAGDEHTLAIKSDGSVWAWGANEGRLGLGEGPGDEILHYAVPMPVVGSDGSGHFQVFDTPPANARIDISGAGRVVSADGTIDCPGVCAADYPGGTPLTLTAIPQAGSEFLGWGGACTGTLGCTLTLDEDKSVTANFLDATSRYRLDSPINGSLESGIGVVYGWVCEAGAVGFQVDANAPVPTAYGADRPDSQAVCGDSLNGFAAVINWNDYGDGLHTLTLLGDDVALTQVSVHVTTLGISYLRGASARLRVDDFPASGLRTDLAWSEPDQNFVVASPVPASASSPAFAASAAPRANWESPMAGGTLSGLALIRGWACDAIDVTATLDDGAAFELPYGSARDDTLERCGDRNNGYALALDWNAIGDGTHILQLFLDGVLSETRVFRVASPAAQGRVIGVQKEQGVSDFPYPGDQLSLQWSEPHQNFRLVEYRAAQNDAIPLDAASPAIVGAGPGDHTYALDGARLAANQRITLSDAQGDNVLQLAAGLAIERSLVAPDALRLFLGNGAQVTLLGAAAFGYALGDGAQTPLSFGAFAQGQLGVAVPASGIASGGAVTIAMP